jgi:hypothetical protein
MSNDVTPRHAASPDSAQSIKSCTKFFPVSAHSEAEKSSESPLELAFHPAMQGVPTATSGYAALCR